jgi:hypothetical protein
MVAFLKQDKDSYTMGVKNSAHSSDRVHEDALIVLRHDIVEHCRRHVEAERQRLIALMGPQPHSNESLGRAAQALAEVHRSLQSLVDGREYNLIMAGKKWY